MEEKKRGRPPKKRFYVGVEIEWGTRTTLRSFIYEPYGDINYEKLMTYIKDKYSCIHFCIHTVKESK